ncbi:methyltransferase domain-containing protein [Nocardioides sp. HM23]|uniref:Methyltransferase domain-containing protein n=2 Tax=Nocardioides bizhenqiangii TaxID=3095076 RepID=A0ABZ0ZSA4_9ACTN|nr:MULTISPECIES: methyltransferase domain-containing protein [unclassified Nocardioides]MDZ5619308.1 methyltransferase domain-containing protein [Nocardioides sp. HM23]WQQ26669.1 methyltransferase domain-containing protein [Nocardioides sp. HM61]
MSDHLLRTDRFPRASAYHPDWLRSSVSGGAHSLWMTEWLAELLDLQPGMRVLDLGCGRGASSVFLHREYGVQVWSTDLWFGVDERAARIRDAGVEDAVFPIHADARSLPFARDFFDAVVSVDAYVYFGTDDLYLSYLTRLVRPGGQLGIVGAGLVQELDAGPPEHLRHWWEPSLACLHSADWWRRHWARSGVVDVEHADTLQDGWRLWLQWQYAVAPSNEPEIRALEMDQGRYLGYVRAVARRREATLDDPITSIPVEYITHPLLTDGADARA